MGGETQVWETMLCLGLHGSWLSDPKEKKTVADPADGGVTLVTKTGPFHWGPNGTRSPELGGLPEQRSGKRLGAGWGCGSGKQTEFFRCLPRSRFLASAFPNILVIYLFHCETVLDKRQKGASFQLMVKLEAPKSCGRD